MMLTVATSVAFRPSSRVGKLSLNKSGNIIAYSQKDGTVSMSWSFEESKEIISLDVITGLEFHQNTLIVSDEGFGLFAFNKSGEEVWKCEIPGGVSLFTICQDFIAVVDTLGRLITVSLTGGIISQNFPYSSIISVHKARNGVIICQEDGRLIIADKKTELWSRPMRGEVGESITCIHFLEDGRIIIGREGYALVPGEEEALEIEIWDFNSKQIIARKDVSARLVSMASFDDNLFFGFDDGIILQSNSNSLINLELKQVMDCKYPVSNIIASKNGVFASSWFYINGISNDGKAWQVEHKGIIDQMKYSHNFDFCIFSGEDQNDWTDVEPIGKFSFDQGFQEIDKSELTLWFEDFEQQHELSAEELYSDDDDIEEYLHHDDIEKYKQGTIIDDNIDLLLSALEEEVVNDVKQVRIDDQNIPTEIDEMAAYPEEDLFRALNSNDEVLQLPRANAGDDRTIQSDDSGNKIVVLDGSLTFDPNNLIKSWSWKSSDGKEIADVKAVKVKLSIGIHQFELRITDTEGNSNSDFINIKVV